ncbi:hypothetical protein AcW1_002871 [Taiwanofungus camphoratus]|nr:hypothetical protein AcV5_009463 [Antrodia cinnamomea]KAI0943168.1 hypothetical protein AcV7_002391 [Antrodia cinnamomea]KAI0943793.1 hypothetical protein AcW1_002871 [Antrodia cinnamomea]
MPHLPRSPPPTSGQSRPHTRPYTLSFPSSAAFLACLVVLALTTVLNIVFSFYNVALLKQLLPPEREYTYIDGDYPAQLPLKLPPVGLPLESGEPHFSLYNDAEWGTLFPSDGFTDLGPNNRTFLLSMIHQMHCLDIIRVGYVVNRTGAAHHIEHCLRYLRQMVLCHADTTLEADTPVFIDGRWEHASAGVGMVHRCKDWTMVRRHLLDHPSTPVVQ